MRYVIAFSVTLSLLVIVAFYQTIAAALLVIGYTAAVVLALAGAVTLFFGSWYVIERLRMIRAARIEAEKHAHVTLVTDNGQTWVRDTDIRATWRNLTGSPALSVSGVQARPQEWEMDLYRLRLLTQGSRAQVIPGQAQILPETATEAEPLDLLAVFTQRTQSYAIIGGQQTGKTFQARHIANSWVIQGIKPLVVGPKWRQRGVGRLHPVGR